MSAERPVAPVFLFAGSMEQARFYARKLGLTPNQWRYPVSKTSRGLRQPVVYMVGTCYERPDYSEVMDALGPARPKFLNEDGQEVEP